jgi:hypothetical protein
MAGLHGMGFPPNLAPLFAKAGIHSSGFFSTWYISTAALPYLVAAAIIAFFAPNTDQIFRIAERYTDQSRAEADGRLWRTDGLWALGTGVLLAICVLNLSGLSEFLYFRF